MSEEQEMWMLGLVFKPAIAFVFFLVAAILARLILRLIPNGKLKKLLSRRVGP